MAWIIGIVAFLIFLVKYPKPTLSVVAVLAMAGGGVILYWRHDAQNRSGRGDHRQTRRQEGFSASGR